MMVLEHWNGLLTWIIYCVTPKSVVHVWMLFGVEPLWDIPKYDKNAETSHTQMALIIRHPPCGWFQFLNPGSQHNRTVWAWAVYPRTLYIPCSIWSYLGMVGGVPSTLWICPYNSLFLAYVLGLLVNIQLCQPVHGLVSIPSHQLVHSLLNINHDQSSTKHPLIIDYIPIVNH